MQSPRRSKPACGSCRPMEGVENATQKALRDFHPLPQGSESSSRYAALRTPDHPRTFPQAPTRPDDWGENNAREDQESANARMAKLRPKAQAARTTTPLQLAMTEPSRRSLSLT